MRGNFKEMKGTDKLRELCSTAGKKAHATGAAFEWDAVSGKAAGQKGGRAYAIRLQAHKDGKCATLSPPCKHCAREVQP